MADETSAPGGFAAVVFDCDGLLLDTEDCWTRAESTLFERYGRVFDLTAKTALIGSAGQTSARILERLLDRPGHGAQLNAELLHLAFETISNGALAMPGARRLVEEVRRSRPVALASNSPRALVMTALNRASLEDGFDAIVCGDEVAEPKPAPEIYLLACQLLGVAPSDTVALEDSPTGVAAARAAGLFVVGIPSLPEISLDADLVAGSLTDGRLREALGLPRMTPLESAAESTPVA